MATLATFNPQALTSTKFPIQLRSFGRSLPAIRRAKAMGSSSSVARSSSSIARSLSSSSPSVTGNDGSKVDALGDVSILAASTGEPVFFRDLWDQNEIMNMRYECGCKLGDSRMLHHMYKVIGFPGNGCGCTNEAFRMFLLLGTCLCLKRLKPQFDAAGVKLIAVGVGTPDKARLLAEQLPFPVDCLYIDPDHKAKMFSRYESLKKPMKNYTIAATPDDKSSVLQQGTGRCTRGKMKGQGTMHLWMTSLTSAAKFQLHEMGLLAIW